MKNYRKENIPRAGALRKNMTPWERKLWYEFLSGHPLRFQRQKAIGPYIVDFYCSTSKLIIELDGGGHYERLQAAKDEKRTKVLENMGFKVVRISNIEVQENFEGVCEYINKLL